MFEDETGFSKHPRVTRVWTRPGQRRRVPTRSEHRQRLNVFGWVAPRTGWHGLLRVRQIRYERTSNHWFPDLDHTWLAIRDTSRRWSLEKIRRLCNIL